MIVHPPEDWNDIGGWDAYHAKDDPFSFLFPESAGVQYVRSFRERNFQRLWLAGCGQSLGPRAFAEQGSTFSRPMSRLSRSPSRRRRRLPPTKTSRWPACSSRERSGPARIERRPGTLALRVHDFRQLLGEGGFNVVLNVRAFQGFGLEDMRRIARVHAEAVRPGGWAIFETQNVQGHARNQLEDALIEAGLVVPVHRTTSWYRAALAATRISHKEILGRPIGYHATPWEQEKLDSIAAEYRVRAEEEARETEGLLKDPSTKTAFVVYNTG